MTYAVTKYPHGHFSWADVQSTDFEKTRSFLEGLFGWTSVDMPTGEGRPDYTMFYLDGKQVAGGSPGFDKNIPTYWSNYINVDSVDTVVKKAEELGATIVMPAMDVLESGRMAAIKDPTGATVGLWQPRNHKGAAVVNTVGAMCWNELYTPDADKAKKFFEKLLGWTYSTMPGQGDYTTIINNNRMNGGVMQITPEMGSFPPNWSVYFTVASREDSLKKVKELGGSIMTEVDVPVGKIAFVSDPTGGFFAIMEMAQKPDEWEE